MSRLLFNVHNFKIRFLIYEMEFLEENEIEYDDANNVCVLKLTFQKHAVHKI